MKRFLAPLLCTILVFAMGCADQPAPDVPPPADAEVATINLEGDFNGPLGVQLYSFRDALSQDVPGTLARVRALGFEEVEAYSTHGLSADSFRTLLDDAGLRATAMHAGYDRLRDSLSVVLDEAEALGVDYVGLAWIPHDGAFTEETARETAALFNQWGAAAAERGIQFYYHPHGYEFQPTAAGTTPFELLMAETDPANVVYEMDVFWVTRPGQDPTALLRQYPDRWELMHIKDMTEGTATDDHSGGAPPEAQAVVGQGQIDYRSVLSAAEEIGVERYYIEDETAEPFTTVPQSLDWLETARFDTTAAN